MSQPDAIICDVIKDLEMVMARTVYHVMIIIFLYKLQWNTTISSTVEKKHVLTYVKMSNKLKGVGLQMNRNIFLGNLRNLIDQLIDWKRSFNLRAVFR